MKIRATVWTALGTIGILCASAGARQANSAPGDAEIPASALEEHAFFESTAIAPGAVVDVSSLEALRVLRITDDAKVVAVGEDGEQRMIALAGVAAARWNDRSTALALRDLLMGERICIVPEEGAAGVSGSGSGGGRERPRILARAPEGLVINVELLRQGAARLSASPPRAWAAALADAQQRAKEASRGVWGAKGTKPRVVAPEEERAPETPTEPKRTTAREPAKREPVAKAPADGSATVYVTASGKKYHAEGCQHLSKSSRAITLEEAKKAYEPCSSCSPPR